MCATGKVRTENMLILFESRNKENTATKKSVYKFSHD